MENAADALVMALGMLIFILGLTALFRMVPLAKNTAETLIAENQRNKYKTYYEATGVNGRAKVVAEDGTELENTRNIGTLNTIDPTTGNRIVKIYDIIPSLYRYSQENFGVTIIDNNGEIVARFDHDTERACNTWTTVQDYTKIKFIRGTNKDLIGRVNVIRRKEGKAEIPEIFLETDGNTDVSKEKITNNGDGMKLLFEKLYRQKRITENTKEIYCYWTGKMEWTAQRVDSDLCRIYGII